MQVLIIMFIAYLGFKNLKSFLERPSWANQMVQKDLEIIGEFPINRKNQQRLGPKKRPLTNRKQGPKSKANTGQNKILEEVDRDSRAFKEDFQVLNPSESQGDIPPGFEEETHIIQDPDLAISTQSVFEDVSLEHDIETAEMRYSGEYIEDASWMDLEESKVLMQVDHSVNTNSRPSNPLSFQQEDLVRGIIFSEILQGPKAKLH